MRPLFDGAPPLRVHFVVHHHRDRAAGASGATLALGDALGQLGCTVSYYFFDDAFGEETHSEVGRMLRFPWRVARHLARTARGVDIVDATSGDAWVWCWRGRLAGGGARLVTRAHGLEHVTAEDLRRRARSGEVVLSRKYPLYHGGFRLWEVKRSMTGADGQIFLNEQDRTYAMSYFGVARETSVVLPNGVPDALLDLPRVALETSDSPATTGSAPIALAFVGSWIPRKGTRAIVEMARQLHARGVPFSLRLLGTGLDASSILEAFAPEVREHVRVTLRFAPIDLPSLLSGAEVLLHPSWTEGFSLALVEGMACGLAPIATRSGGATQVVRDGVSGLLLNGESGDALADAVLRVAGNRVMLAQLRVAAQAAMQQLRWTTVAAETLAFYHALPARRALAMGRA